MTTTVTERELGINAWAVKCHACERQLEMDSRCEVVVCPCGAKTCKNGDPWPRQHLRCAECDYPLDGGRCPNAAFHSDMVAARSAAKARQTDVKCVSEETFAERIRCAVLVLNAINDPHARSAVDRLMVVAKEILQGQS